MHQDGDTSKAADFIAAGADAQSDAKLLHQALFDAFKIAEAAQVFQAVQQLLLIFSCQSQHAQVTIRALQQCIAPAVTSTGWAFGADGEGANCRCTDQFR